MNSSSIDVPFRTSTIPSSQPQSCAHCCAAFQRACERKGRVNPEGSNSGEAAVDSDEPKTSESVFWDKFMEVSTFDKFK